MPLIEINHFDQIQRHSVQVTSNGHCTSASVAHNRNWLTCMDVADWDWYWTLGQTTLHSRSSTLGLRAFKVIEKSKEMQNDR